MGFWHFHEEGVTGGSLPSCSYLGWGRKHREGKGCKTRMEVEEDREATDLSDKLMDSLIMRDSNDLEVPGLHHFKLSKM